MQFKCIHNIAGNYVSSYSDSGGNIAFYEPGFEGDIFFNVYSDGYSLDPNQDHVEMYNTPYDSGIHLNVSYGENSGGGGIIYMVRHQLAKRLYRLTGSGLYADSYLSNQLSSIPQSIIDSNRVLIDDVKVLGQDTVMTVTFNNKVLWFFGDTTCLCSARQNNCENYGMYTVGASSCLPSDLITGQSQNDDDDADDDNHDSPCISSQPPPLKYFSSSEGGFLHVAPMATLPPLDQNTWIAAVFTLPSSSSASSSQAKYANFMKNPGDGENAGPTATGMVKWNPDSETFDFLSEFPDNHTFLNGAHTIQQLSPEDSGSASNYVYFNSQIRVSGDEVSIMDPSQYEYYNFQVKEWLPLDESFYGDRPKFSKNECIYVYIYIYEI
jgi:hypothetical protein